MEPPLLTGTQLHIWTNCLDGHKMGYRLRRTVLGVCRPPCDCAYRCAPIGERWWGLLLITQILDVLFKFVKCLCNLCLCRVANVLCFLCDTLDGVTYTGHDVCVVIRVRHNVMDTTFMDMNKSGATSLKQADCESICVGERSYLGIPEGLNRAEQTAVRSLSQCAIAGLACESVGFDVDPTVLIGQPWDKNLNK
ncbi:MAG: hypothetical protein J07HX5_01431 [halophilic archaeon J07HX5]|nr:MAG: hypothetical protein J07HX5_01431 [halophilic archaeon J07HX5]